MVERIAHTQGPIADHVRMSFRTHRDVVVARLLDRGVEPGTLLAILPDWADAILAQQQTTSVASV